MTLPPIDLPWPASALSPNSRLHWRAKAAKVKHARLVAFALLSASVPARERKLDWAKVGVRVEFFPPDRRHRDRDNIQASCHWLSQAADQPGSGGAPVVCQPYQGCLVRRPSGQHQAARTAQNRGGRRCHLRTTGTGQRRRHHQPGGRSPYGHGPGFRSPVCCCAPRALWRCGSHRN